MPRWRFVLRHLGVYYLLGPDASRTINQPKQISSSSLQTFRLTRLFWLGVFLFLGGLFDNIARGAAVYFAVVVVLLSAGLFIPRGVYRYASVLLLAYSALCIVVGYQHDAEQRRWLREHSDSFSAKSLTERQQWLQEHYPSLANPHTHP